jgi:hypothetical protein
LSDIATFLPDDVALLSYATLGFSGERLTLFCITREEGKTVLKTYEVPRAAPDMLELLDDFRADCANPVYRYKNKARELYDLLLAPASAQFAGKKRLIICPDGVLWDCHFKP